MSRRFGPFETGPFSAQRRMTTLVDACPDSWDARPNDTIEMNAAVRFTAPFRDVHLGSDAVRFAARITHCLWRRLLSSLTPAASFRRWAPIADLLATNTTASRRLSSVNDCNYMQMPSDRWPRHISVMFQSKSQHALRRIDAVWNFVGRPKKFVGEHLHRPVSIDCWMSRRTRGNANTANDKALL
jgi:hypothetical protein